MNFSRRRSGPGASCRLCCAPPPEVFQKRSRPLTSWQPAPPPLLNLGRAIANWRGAKTTGLTPILVGYAGRVFLLGEWVRKLHGRAGGNVRQKGALGKNWGAKKPEFPTPAV